MKIFDEGAQQAPGRRGEVWSSPKTFKCFAGFLHAMMERTMCFQDETLSALVPVEMFVVIVPCVAKMKSTVLHDQRMP